MHAPFILKKNSFFLFVFHQTLFLTAQCLQVHGFPSAVSKSWAHLVYFSIKSCCSFLFLRFSGEAVFGTEFPGILKECFQGRTQVKFFKNLEYPVVSSYKLKAFPCMNQHYCLLYYDFNLNTSSFIYHPLMFSLIAVTF